MDLFFVLLALLLLAFPIIAIAALVKSVGLGEHLQASSEIGRFADNFVLLCHAEVAHDDEPGGYANPDLRGDVRGPVALL